MKMLELFKGQYLYFIIRSVKTPSPTALSVKNMTVHGVLIDADDANYYIGNDEGNIQAIVAISEVALSLTEETASSMLMDVISESMNSGEVQ